MTARNVPVSRRDTFFVLSLMNGGAELVCEQISKEFTDQFATLLHDEDIMHLPQHIQIITKATLFAVFSNWTLSKVAVICHVTF